MTENADAYQMCTNCVMDTSDPTIIFDENGVCNHCHEFENVTSKRWHPNAKGSEMLSKLIAKIKQEGEGKEYDCIMGLSGGADSSYMALKVRDWGLRPLVVHVDAGWNSEIAVNNIERIVKHCKFDLNTHVIAWEEMRDLHLAYLKAAVANQDVPQDHAFFASLYHFAAKNNIKYILSGGNIATEAVSPKSWHGSAMDAMNLKDIYKKYGSKKSLKKYPTISFFDCYIYYPLIKGVRTVRPLNFMSYNKEEAIKYLQTEIGWRPYGRKHGESVFTKLFQNYYLPTKFGYDKRKLHLSSMILSGQISRADALKQLAEPLYDSKELESDIMYFCKKLRISRAEFDQYMKAPIHDYSDFSNWGAKYKWLKIMQRIGERLLGRKIQVYS